MKKALIIGISGQDGAYLAEFLLKKGYAVYGTSRDAQAHSFKNLIALGIKNDVQLLSLNTAEFRSVLSTLQKIKPGEIYNLSGQSSVGLSFDQPIETFESISVATINLLESIRFLSLDCRFYNAGSSEMFGDTPETGAVESTPMNPRSPYAIAKMTSYYQVRNFREAYNLQCSTGILFNHESPLRPDRFVTKKIIRGVIEIAQNKRDILQLGNIDIVRDWGHAQEYVEAMWLMLQQPTMDDFIIATGKSHNLKYFIERAFSHFNLDWQKFTQIDSELMRPSDIKFSKGNPAHANKVLGWKSKKHLDDVITDMIERELNSQTKIHK